MPKRCLKNVLMAILLALVSSCSIISPDQRPPASEDLSCEYFKIQVVGRQTGRGVPLVELRTTNNIRYFTDSNGIAAFYEPGLMDRDVFFFVESHGYEFPKDGFGFRGIRLKTMRGGSAVIKINRINIAERLYRVTGQGIYRDSVLTGYPVPLQNPVLTGQVTGQDSVYNCIYRDRLFWLWGDTNRPSYPLGHFGTAGAVSNLPEHGGLDPAIGVNLEYYVSENGFSRPICPFEEPGMIWLDGLLTVEDNEGRQRMVAKFARMKGLGQAYERGLVVFNDAKQSFEPLVRSGVEFLPFSNSGHAFRVSVDGKEYYYFGTQFPLAVRMRVRAKWEDILDPNRYEVLTSLGPKISSDENSQPMDLAKNENPYRWIRTGELVDGGTFTKASLIKALKEEKKNVHLYDIESGKRITPHGGSVYFNNYRNRWVMITVQQFGESSYLGDVWYAEADSPAGPWAYTRKIITHNKYSFYNPKQHPYFDKDDGRVLFFEGTYTHTFSGSAEKATPRYDYNQIMYRLNLDDSRLALPVAVYQVRDKQGQKSYLLREEVEKAGEWDIVESIPFYAIEPAKADDSLTPVYAETISTKSGRTISLSVKRSGSSAGLLFYALPSSDQMNENSRVTALFEYRHADTGQRFYSIEKHMQNTDWIRMENPLCYVWKAPSSTLLLDCKAKPVLRQ
ncbi:MAG: hypothetical protein H8D56_02250 [Planctomycetes bacterium]|nr:hypothetical protein [Planctomycetota bacterium]MBL7143521.1 hypothetical protein [Phycisphaerae bacterium]